MRRVSKYGRKGDDSVQRRFEHEVRELAGGGHVTADEAEGAGISISVGAKTVCAVDNAGDFAGRIEVRDHFAVDVIDIRALVDDETAHRVMHGGELRNGIVGGHARSWPLWQP